MIDLQKLSQDLTDKGLLIEAGFVGLRSAAIPKDASEVQLREMRMAFFAGAQHLFSSIMAILDPGEEPTDKDLARLTLINDELETFGKTFAANHIPTKGRA